MCNVSGKYLLNVKASTVRLMGWGGMVYRVWDIVCLTRRRSLAGWSSSKDSLPRDSSSLFATLSFCPHLPKEEEGKKMGAKPFWFSVNLLTQCLQGLIVSEDQDVEEFHVPVTKVEELVGVHLRYLGAILEHPIRRQNFAGKSHLNFYNI